MTLDLERGRIYLDPADEGMKLNELEEWELKVMSRSTTPAAALDGSVPATQLTHASADCELQAAMHTAANTTAVQQRCCEYGCCDRICPCCRQCGGPRGRGKCCCTWGSNSCTG